MEAVVVLIPIAISIGTCIMVSCLNQRTNNRILDIEQGLINLSTQINTPRQTYQPTPVSQYPQPSAPPGYGYQYYSGDPNSPLSRVV
jgi:hypothetical protein